MPPWSTQSAAEFPLSTLADLFTAGFAGYLIPLVMTSDALAERLAAEDIHLASSRVLLLDAQPAGLALIARRGRESRLAAMAIVQPARHRGAGRALLAPLLEDARVRGDRRMRLEVFESNLPARALYEGAGFRRTARLVGYDLPSPPAIAAGLREVDATEFARQLARCDAGPLPWQLEPASLSARGRALLLAGGEGVRVRLGHPGEVHRRPRPAHARRAPPQRLGAPPAGRSRGAVPGPRHLGSAARAGRAWRGFLHRAGLPAVGADTTRDGAAALLTARLRAA